MLDTQYSRDELILIFADDDEEDSPWMAMNDPQFDAASSLYTVLRAYAHGRGLEWYVASMLPILYPKPSTSPWKGKVAPDLYVAFVPEYPRTSFDVQAEGQFPPFVLEVLSAESVDRDLGEKLDLYRILGAREYLVFAPTPDLGHPPLAGYRRRSDDTFENWELDDGGRLFSDVLGLSFFSQDQMGSRLLRVQEPDGKLLPTLEELQTENIRLREELRRLTGQ